MRIPFRGPFRGTLVLLAAGAILCACFSAPSAQNTGGHVGKPRIARIASAARSWELRPQRTPIGGLALLRDGAPFTHSSLAVARSIQTSNPRIAAFDALYLADVAIQAAQDVALDPEFFCATMLQESAFDPDVISSAGAIGIAQFTIETADANGVAPFDARSALRGAAALIADYLNRYRRVYDDPYAAALAAYNAGPQAVAAYHGVPPFAETRQYIGYVYERWALLLSDTATQRRV